MKRYTTLLLLFVSSFSFAQTEEVIWQYAIVQDKDGYCNVRSSAENANNVTDKLYNEQAVFVTGQQGNWMSITYTKNNKEQWGYIYHDRLKLVSQYTGIPEAAQEENSLSFSGSNIKVLITRQNFNKNGRKITYANKDNTGGVTQIDGKRIYGTDGEMPTQEYRSIVITSGANKITLPKAAMDKLYQPSLDRTEVYYDKEKDIIYISASNSDGAGGYNVLWKIEKGQYKGRNITQVN